MNIGLIVVGIIVIIGYINLGIRYFNGKPVWTDEDR